MITNCAALAALRATVATVVRPASAFDAYVLNGGRVTVCRPSRRGMNVAQKIRVKPTRIAKSRG